MLQIVLVLTTERILGAIEGWTSHEGVAKVDVSGMRPALLYNYGLSYTVWNNHDSVKERRNRCHRIRAAYFIHQISPLQQKNRKRS